MIRKHKYKTLEELFEHFRETGTTAEDIQATLEESKPSLLRPRARWGLLKMKSVLRETIESLMCVEDSLESLEEHPIESIDNSEGTIPQLPAEEVINRSLEVMKEVSMLRNSHVHFTQSRNVQHFYTSPGDPTPVLRSFGPTKAVLTVTYDEGELNIARSKQ